MSDEARFRSLLRETAGQRLGATAPGHEVPWNVWLYDETADRMEVEVYRAIDAAAARRVAQEHAGEGWRVEKVERTA